jgi:DNA-binding NtrC family response regulator
LENALEYATTVCEGQTIHLGDLPVELGPGNGDGPYPLVPKAERKPPQSSMDESGSGGPESTLNPGPHLSPGEVEEVDRIRQALKRTQYRREEAASLLGMSRTTLWRKMKEYRM